MQVNLLLAKGLGIEPAGFDGFWASEQMRDLEIYYCSVRAIAAITFASRLRAAQANLQ